MGRGQGVELRVLCLVIFPDHSLIPIPPRREEVRTPLSMPLPRASQVSPCLPLYGDLYPLQAKSLLVRYPSNQKSY